MHERIVVNPNIYGGKPCIRGTRIAVYMILELLEDGLSFEEIIKDYYPHITKEDIRACLKYARAVVENEEIHVVARQPQHEFGDKCEEIASWRTAGGS